MFSADFEFEKSEVSYREKVLQNLEEYIHQIFPGMPQHGDMVACVRYLNCARRQRSVLTIKILSLNSLISCLQSHCFFLWPVRFITWCVPNPLFPLFPSGLDYEQPLFFLIVRRERSGKKWAARKLARAKAGHQLSRCLFFVVVVVVFVCFFFFFFFFFFLAPLSTGYKKKKGLLVVYLWTITWYACYDFFNENISNPLF